MRWLEESVVRVALLDGVPSAGPVRTLLADAAPSSEEVATTTPTGGLQ
jgi:hypothetical protein